MTALIALLLVGGVLFTFTSAWTGHTPQSRACADRIIRTAHTLGWKLSYLAHLLGLTAQQFSRQLAGGEPLNYWRIANLPDEFHEVYDRLRAEDRGALLIERDAVQIIRALDAQPKPVLKVERRIVTLPLSRTREA